VEQLLQKEEKRSRSVTCRATDAYSGSWFPVSQGLGVCLAFPCTDEPRIAIAAGDYLVVTRSKKHWLYGEKLKLVGERRRERGWFPRRVVVQVHIAKNHEISHKTDDNLCTNDCENKKLN
jgi:hypothetical protein